MSIRKGIKYLLLNFDFKWMNWGTISGPGYYAALNGCSKVKQKVLGVFYKIEKLNNLTCKRKKKSV